MKAIEIFDGLDEFQVEAAVLRDPAADGDENHPAEMPRDRYLREELYLLHEEIAAMVDRGSWQAVVAARRLALQYRTELDALRNATAADIDITDPAAIVADLLALPDEVWEDPRIRARVAALST